VSLFQHAYDLCEVGDYRQALRYYSEILKHEPKNVKALIDTGVTYQNLENLKKSIEFYEKALNLDSKNTDAMVNKGSALHALGFFSRRCTLL